MRNKFVLFTMAVMLMTTGLSSSPFILKAADLKPIPAKVNALLQDQVSFKPFNIFSLNSSFIIPIDPVSKKTTYATLNFDQLAGLTTAKNDFIEFTFPFNGETITVLLYEVTILTDDFKVVTDQSNGHSVEYAPGIYYQGIVKGDETSLSSFSFFGDEMAILT